MSVHLNDIGTLIKLDVHTDVSTSTQLSILFQRPDKTFGEWSATLIEIDQIGYLTQAGDLNQIGVWSLQPKVEMAGWSGTGSIVNMTVEKNLQSAI